MAGIAVILSILPFIPLDFWWIRSFDFPHVQLTALTVIVFLLYCCYFKKQNIKDYIFTIILIVCILFQFLKIYPYTILSEVEVLDATTTESKGSLRIYTANVYQDNKKSKELFSSIRKRDPDVLLFTETNSRWRDLINKELSDIYTFKTEAPFENTYGMLLFSKYELIDSSVQFLIEDTIPSIHSKMLLSAKDTIQLIAIHPAPPVPQHNPSSVDRDAEMMKVAKKAQFSKYPVIVMGDFNDVAWSETTELFQKVSGLLDMRKGRGLYNTYNAHNILFRWPLDHIFVSPEFRVITVEKGECIGSDHFPFFSELSYEPQGTLEQQSAPPSKDDMEEGYDQIQNEREQEDS
ncbi:endonuclease/exonuclease/phosphatase family protein [Aquimarina addita]|uniref:Endonuclease/exonuclease/phosphatase family protein n=2 Tax=Aquimarina addita TaxID=870485 RepID=A0ABP6ULS0_9FLAO